MKIHTIDVQNAVHCLTVVQDDYILYLVAKGEKIIWERKVLRARKDTMHMIRRAVLEQSRMMTRAMFVPEEVLVDNLSIIG